MPDPPPSPPPPPPSPPPPPPSPPPTPPSENTFADRLQRGRDMQAAIAIFTPAFAPADSSLAPTAFATFLDGLSTLHTATSTLVTSYTTGAGERMTMVKEIKDVSSRVLSYLKSNPAWKKHLPGIKPLVEKIIGNSTRKSKAPQASETPGSAQAKSRKKGEQSFGDIASNFGRLVSALGAVVGYTPTTADLTIANLTTRSTAYLAKNATMSTLGQSVGMNQRERTANYDGDTSLRSKMKDIKQAVRAQYGTNSPQNAQIKTIKL